MSSVSGLESKGEYRGGGNTHATREEVSSSVFVRSMMSGAVFAGDIVSKMSRAVFIGHAPRSANRGIRYVTAAGQGKVMLMATINIPVLCNGVVRQYFDL